MSFSLHLKNFAKYDFFQMSICILVFRFFSLKPIFTLPSTLGMSLSAGSSPLHSPKITPHTSPAPRRRSHTPNPANYMVPSSASTPGNNSVSQTPSSGQVIQKETVGGTTYFYTDTTPAPLSGMVRVL